METPTTPAPITATSTASGKGSENAIGVASEIIGMVAPHVLRDDSRPATALRSRAASGAAPEVRAHPRTRPKESFDIS